jgi:hypothetical protein
MPVEPETQPDRSAAAKQAGETGVPCPPDQPVFLRVPAAAVPAVLAGLRAGGHAAEAARVEAFVRDYLDPAANAERLRWLARADDQTARDGEVEFDSDATISHSDDPVRGQYVLGWVWVDGPSEESKADDA